MSIKLQNKSNYLVGVISDTHGFLQPSAIKLFTDTDLIIHAGDIDKPAVLSSLQSIAPVVAVRGNMDKGTWAAELAETQVIKVGEVLVYVLHNLHILDINPVSAGFNAVISDHTHKPCVVNQKGVLFLNPGSATLPITLQICQYLTSELQSVYRLLISLAKALAAV
ncbi:MAG: metallophosphoesterase family protein [Desulfobacteraceae bacterium]|nr:metallophosphoesterase family protein [Desulfobacteraceae bacterium]